jgi:hypothetical protein
MKQETNSKTQNQIGIYCTLAQKVDVNDDIKRRFNVKIDGRGGWG